MKTRALESAVKKLVQPVRNAVVKSEKKIERAAHHLVDVFEHKKPAQRMPVLSGVATPPPAPPVADNATKTEASKSVTPVGPAKSPYFDGRIHREGRAMVGESGQAFTWRGVSEFLLPKYMNDKSRSPEENEAIVAKRMDERVAQGFSVLRMFGNVAWDSGSLNPFDDWEGYKQNLEKTLSMAKERGLYVELTALTDVGKAIPKNRVGEYMDFIAQLTSRYDNTFVELCNESFKNGMSKQELYDLGRRFKQLAPNVMLAGSSPVGDGVDGTDDGGVTFAKAPFDYVTIHSERSDGDGGFRWVRHMREGEGVGAEANIPVVQDEPIGSNAVAIPGRRDNDPQHFRDGALVAAVTNQGFTFHTERAVTMDPNAVVPEPGADVVKTSDLIPADPRGTHFVNGHWADSPFDVGDQFEKNVLRVFTKMKDDRSGFWTYPVDVMNDLDMKVKSGTHLTVVDVNTGNRLEDRDFASGETLYLPKGSDVVIYGGNAEVPAIRAPSGGTPAIPDVPGGSDPVPPQSAMPLTRDPRLPGSAAEEAVARLYQGILGREIEPEHPWKEWFANGQYSMAINGLMQSGEFANRRDGLTNGAFADGLYRSLLGRPAGDDLEGAVARINSGGAAALVHDLTTSDEFLAPLRANAKEAVPAQRPATTGFAPRFNDAQAQRITERLYRALLGRDPDAGGASAWSRLVATGGLRKAVSGIMGSGEFASKVGDLDVDGLAKRLYTTLLDRDGDADGLEGTRQTIRDGRMADRVVAMILSDEYRAKN